MDSKSTYSKHKIPMERPTIMTQYTIYSFRIGAGERVALPGIETTIK